MVVSTTLFYSYATMADRRSRQDFSADLLASAVASDDRQAGGQGAAVGQVSKVGR